MSVILNFLKKFALFFKNLVSVLIWKCSVLYYTTISGYMIDIWYKKSAHLLGSLWQLSFFKNDRSVRNKSGDFFSAANSKLEENCARIIMDCQLVKTKQKEVASLHKYLIISKSKATYKVKKKFFRDLLKNFDCRFLEPKYEKRLRKHVSKCLIFKIQGVKENILCFISVFGNNLDNGIQLDKSFITYLQLKVKL